MGIFRKYALAALATAAFTTATTQTASAAVIIDLIGGNTGTANGAIYEFIAAGSTGTGVIQSFLRIQNNGAEQGYNNSVGTPWDTKGGMFTHDIQMSNLVVKTISGVGYYEFLLDVNQNKCPKGKSCTDPYLSLNNIQMFTRSTAIVSATESLAGLGTLRFNMDQVGGLGAANDVTVNLDASRNPGSGYGDMFFYVRTSLFAGAAGSDYLYFYSAFGDAGSYEANDGFEEWATVKPGPTITSVPEPSTLAMILVSLLSLLGFGYRMSRSARA